MRVKSDVVGFMHLDPAYGLMSVQNIVTCIEYFRLLDIHYNGSINDCQFWAFIRSLTDLTREESDKMFHLVDIDKSGEMEFEEFYFIFCIIIANKDNYQKEFLYRHSKTLFHLLDTNASGELSKKECLNLGILFDFDDISLRRMFNAFDVTNATMWDFTEFRLFTMACIDQQRKYDANFKVHAFLHYQKAFFYGLKDVALKGISTNRLPRPEAIVDALYRLMVPVFKPELTWKEWLRVKLQLYNPHVAVVWMFDRISKYLALFGWAILLSLGKIGRGIHYFFECVGGIFKTRRQKEATYLKRVAKTNIGKLRYYQKNKALGNIKTKKIVGTASTHRQESTISGMPRMSRFSLSTRKSRGNKVSNVSLEGNDPRYIGLDKRNYFE